MKLKVLDKLHGCSSQSISTCSNTCQRKRCSSLIKDKVILWLVLWTCFRMHLRYKGKHNFKTLGAIRLECKGEVFCPSESTASWRNKKHHSLINVFKFTINWNTMTCRTRRDKYYKAYLKDNTGKKPEKNPQLITICYP